MMDHASQELVFRKVPNSPRESHHAVLLGGEQVGEVWREMTRLHDCNGAPTIKRALRWYAKAPHHVRVIGKGRTAMLLGGGFKSRQEAACAMHCAP